MLIKNKYEKVIRVKKDISSYDHPIANLSNSMIKIEIYFQIAF